LRLALRRRGLFRRRLIGIGLLRHRGQRQRAKKRGQRDGEHPAHRFAHR